MASKLRWALAAAVLPVFSFAITEAEVAASARAYFAPMTSANFWRMRMPDGLIREFELRESGNGKLVRLWPDRKDVRGKDIGPESMMGTVPICK